jgi:hypothetical protein
MSESIFSQIQQARRAGHSDDEILGYLSQSGAFSQQQLNEVSQGGFASKEVLDYLAQNQPKTVTDKLKGGFAGDVVRGLRDIPDAGAQLLTRGLEAISPKGSGLEQFARSERERVEAINAEAERDYIENFRRGNVPEGMNFGRLTGNIAATLPLAALTGPIGPGVATGTLAARGGIQGMAGGALQPVQTPGDSFFGQKAQQMAVGGVGGAAGGVIAPKVASAIQGSSRAAAPTTGQGSVSLTGGGSVLGGIGEDTSSALTSSQARLLERSRGLGFRTTPGQASGSRALQQMEARMESNPLFSGPFSQIKNANQATLNRHVADAIGERSTVLDADVLGRADARLGGIFDRVADNVKRIVPQDDVTAQLSRIEQDYEGLLAKPLLDQPLVKQFFDQVAKGEMTGAQLRSLSSKMGRAAKNQMSSGAGDRELGQAFFQVKDIVDDLIGQGIEDPALAASYNLARQQYRNLMLVTTRAGVVNPASGNVSGANLAAALQSKDRRGYLFGGNMSDFYDAARFSQAFKPLVGDSGTATRTMPMDALNLALTLPTNLATRAYASQPASNMAAAIAAGADRGLMANVGGDVTAEAIRRALPLSGGLGLLQSLTQ